MRINLIIIIIINIIINVALPPQTYIEAACCIPSKTSLEATPNPCNHAERNNLANRVAENSPLVPLCARLFVLES